MEVFPPKQRNTTESIVNIQKLPTEIANAARHALDEAEDTYEHGRDTLAEKRDEGLSSMSSMIDSGARGLQTLRSAAQTYVTLDAIAASLDKAAPGRRMLGLLGLQRRPSVIARVATSAGFFLAGATVGAGVALLITPRSGAAMRATIAGLFRSARRDAESAARSVETSAREAIDAVGGVPRPLVNDADGTEWNLGNDGQRPPAATPHNGV